MTFSPLTCCVLTRAVSAWLVPRRSEQRMLGPLPRLPPVVWAVYWQISCVLIGQSAGENCRWGRNLYHGCPTSCWRHYLSEVQSSKHDRQIWQRVCIFSLKFASIITSFQVTHTLVGIYTWFGTPNMGFRVTCAWINAPPKFVPPALNSGYRPLKVYRYK
jgi:hypothetical protein